MKEIKLTGIRKMELFDVPAPKIVHPNDVKIRMVVMGICGSDIHYFNQGKIGSQVIDFPFTVGHEGSGIVVETGSGVSMIKPGDRIAIDPAMPCFNCDQCLCGRHHTCRNLRFLGNPGQAEGLLSEFIVMPETSCFVIPDSMTFDEATLTEPLAIGIYSVKQAGAVSGKKIGILGVGPIGESILLPALLGGAAKVYVTDKIDKRLEYARRNGAHWVGNPNKSDIAKVILIEEPLGLDIVFECCGQPEALAQAVEILKPGGKLILVGIPEANAVSFNINFLRHKEITIINIRRQNGCVVEAIDLISGGKISVADWATHRFGFDKAQDAFELVAGYHDGVLKAMIDF